MAENKRDKVIQNSAAKTIPAKTGFFFFYLWEISNINVFV